MTEILLMLLVGLFSAWSVGEVLRIIDLLETKYAN